MEPKHTAIALITIIVLSYIGIQFLSAYLNMVLFIVSTAALALWIGWKLNESRWGWVVLLLMTICALGMGNMWSKEYAYCIGIFCEILIGGNKL